jgi:hypothetical protein
MTERITAQVVRSNITEATQVKVGSGRICMISVAEATLTEHGFIYDAATVGEIAITNMIGAIPDIVGNYLVDMPFYNGLVVAPAASQVVIAGYV